MFCCCRETHPPTFRILALVTVTWQLGTSSSERKAMAEHAKTKNKGPVPGEILPADGFVELNVGRRTGTIVVCNAGDRPIQVGSQYHFFEVNRSLQFSRAEAFGFR